MVRVDRIAPGVPLIDFPMFVVLDGRVDPALLARGTRFFAADGSELAAELEDPGHAWVRVPRLADTSTILTAVFEAPGMAAGPVWTDGYEGVWHMAGTGAVVRDSSVHARDGVATGTSSLAGAVGPARAFNITARDGIVVPGGASVAFPVLTMSAWLRVHSAPAFGSYAALTRERDNTAGDDFMLGTTGLMWLGAVGSPTAMISAYQGGVVDLDTWHHVAFTYDQQGAFYLDGVMAGTSSMAVTIAASPGPFYIGCDRNLATTAPSTPDADYLDGELDEIRIESVARSPAWMSYEDAGMRDQLITYGPVVVP